MGYAVNQTVVTIDAAKSNRIYHQPYHWITADSAEYYFDMTAIWYSGFSMDDSFWCLEEGEELTILYIDRKKNMNASTEAAKAARRTAREKYRRALKQEG